jgi:hypothetical protein
MHTDDALPGEVGNTLVFVVVAECREFEDAALRIVFLELRGAALSGFGTPHSLYL